MKKLGHYNAPRSLIVDKVDIGAMTAQPKIGTNTNNTVTLKATANGFVLENKSDDDKQKPVSMSSNEDPIDSMALINNIKLIDTGIKDFNDIATGSIMLEIKRLIIRCLKADNYTITDVWNNDIVANPAIYTIEYCVSNIITDRKDDRNFFSNMIRYNIDALFDLYRIRQIKERDRVYEFIDYFIEAFVTQK